MVFSSVAETILCKANTESMLMNINLEIMPTVRKESIASSHTMKRASLVMLGPCWDTLGPGARQEHKAYESPHRMGDYLSMKVMETCSI